MKKRHVPAPKTLVSIIIPVMGRFDLLERCLDAIPKACSSAYEIIIVDNASPKEEAIPFYNKRTDITLIRNYENLGFPKACNQGAKKATSPLFFFLNSDVILHENAIDELVMDMDTPNNSVVGMLLVFPEYAEGLNQAARPANKVQHIGMDTNIHGKWIHTFVGWRADNPKVLAQRDCYAVTGAALMTRKNLFYQVGGFDDVYGMGTFEDVDYCMKMKELGYNILVNPKAVGTHFTGATAEFYKIGYPMDQNRMIFLSKWATKLEWSEVRRW